MALKFSSQIIFLAVSSFLVHGCLSKEDSSNNKGGLMPPMPVTMATTSLQDVPVSFEFAGQSSGSREVEVRAKVGGILLKRLYQEGSFVQAGHPLFQIDPVPLQLTHEQAQASLGISQAKLAQAELEYKRANALFADHAISQKERDDAHAAFNMAKADAAMNRAKLKEAMVHLNDTRVTAPISGVANQESLSEGSLVIPNNPSSVLTKITQFHPIYIHFNMSDTDAQEFRKLQANGKLSVTEGFKVRMKLSDGTILPQIGNLNFMDGQVDDQTATIRSRAVFPNANRQVMPGQFVRVLLDGATRHEVITVPRIAVFNAQQGKMVWVYNPSKKQAEARPVVISQQVGEHDVIVENGLQPNEKVIVDNLMKLRPGAPVIDIKDMKSMPTPPSNQHEMSFFGKILHWFSSSNTSNKS
jgi:membrane fusion protein (multidrug efflux system)